MRSVAALNWASREHAVCIMAFTFEVVSGRAPHSIGVVALEITCTMADAAA